jgi:predicted transcriptional regulator
MAISVKIDDKMKERVQHLADLRQRSPHWIMREAIAQYVEREEQRDNFTQEALAAWSAFQATGRHLTGAEVKTWLAGWGTVDETPAPACHE